MASSPRVLVAVGGNALAGPGERATVDTQRQHLRGACRAIAGLAAAGYGLVITHGNGPQVGAALLRSERAAGVTYPLPLDVCVAATQGEVGFLLQEALTNALAEIPLLRPVATILAQVVVAADDAGFRRPTKPIGPCYTPEEAAARRAGGWTMIEEPPCGYRRAVASPEPLEIVEEPAIRALLDTGTIVITLGGGGMAVAGRAGCRRSVEAVIDKDLSSALLATRLRVDRLVLLTDVDRIYLDFAQPTARGLDRVTPAELRHYQAAGQFPPGTMGPKVEAALRFAEATGRPVVVSSIERLSEALRGRAGTLVAGQGREDCHEPHQNAHHGSRGARLPQFQRGVPERSAP